MARAPSVQPRAGDRTRTGAAARRGAPPRRTRVATPPTLIVKTSSSGGRLRRRQYRYHDKWRLRRDRQKFEHMLEFAASLTVLRATIAPGHPSTQGPVEQAVLDLLVEITDEARVEELLESA